MSVKKILMLSAAASMAFAGAAFAGGPDVQQGPMCDAVNLMNGFYAGIGPSYNFSNVRSYRTASQSEFGANGFGGQVFAGYNMLTMGKMYLGLNAFFSMYSLENKDAFSSDFLKTDVRYAFGGTIEPGYSVASNLNVFAQLGYAGLNIKYKESTGSSKTYTDGAWVFGVGSEFGVTPNIGIRTTYSYYYGNKKSVSGQLTGFTNVKPRVGEFMVGVNYHF